MKNFIALNLLLFFGVALMQSCQKTTDDDTNLFNEVKSTAGYTYYTGTIGITAGRGNSPHGFERVRFNTIAQAALDSAGKLPVGASFPDGSVIVKDVYSSASGSVNLHAVMKKATNNSAAGSGYLWAEIQTDGKAVFSTSKKGNGCISCHSGSANRDLARIFDL